MRSSVVPPTHTTLLTFNPHVDVDRFEDGEAWFQLEPESAAEPCAFARSCGIKRKHLHCVGEGCSFVLNSLDFQAFARHVREVSVLIPLLLILL